MASAYVIQVWERAAGKTPAKVVEFEPGLAVEKALITELITRTQAKGVGVFRTEAHVLTDVRDAFEELLYDLKSRVR